MKARGSSVDIISTLPDNILENILCLLPIQQAVRTCILSREWRYKWTNVPKLVFDEDTFEVSSANVNEDRLSMLLKKFGTCDFDPCKGTRMRKRECLIKRCKFFYGIHQVLFLHRHPLLEFALSMEADATCVELDHIIFLLSRKSYVKKLKLDLKDFYGRYSLPLSVLLLQQLTDLALHTCAIYFEPPFSRFACLTSLYLEDVNISINTLLHLISKCPLLKSFSLLIDEGNILGHYEAPMAELFKCLPLIEHLTIWYWAIECFEDGKVPQELPTSLVRLKYFCLDKMYFIGPFGLNFVILILRSSPNLEKLKLLVYPEVIILESKVDYSGIWLEHLSELEIGNFNILEPELEFVKIILEKSPVLKKVRITLDSEVTKDEEMEMLKALLCFPRASRVVGIIVDRNA